MNLNRVLEIFGCNGKSTVRVGEATPDYKKTPIYVTNDGQTTVYITLSEARYLADRLTYLADKIVAKRKACLSPDDDE